MEEDFRICRLGFWKFEMKWLSTRWKLFSIFLLSLGVLYFYLATTIPCPVPPAVPQRVARIEQVRETLTTTGCQPGTYMVVLVGSHPDHREVREVIRRTWGNPKLENYPFKLAFLFGLPEDPDSRRALADESATHGDVIQGDFSDSYHNITARDLMGLRWAAKHCSDARLVMRADDDIALDVYYLLDVLQEPRFNDGTDFLACFYLTRNASVERSGRYGLHPDDFPATVYPDFCHGWMYVLTPRLSLRLVEASQLVPPFWINDVYITGVLMQTLGITVSDLKLRYVLQWELPTNVGSGRSIGGDDHPYAVIPTKAQAWLTQCLQDLFLERAQTLELPRYKQPVLDDTLLANGTIGF